MSDRTGEMCEICGTYAGTEMKSKQWVCEDCAPVAHAFKKIPCERCAELEKERDEAKAILAQVHRAAEIAKKLNDSQTEMDAATTCSFNEAMAYDVLEQTEKERDALSAVINRLEARATAAEADNLRLTNNLAITRHSRNLAVELKLAAQRWADRAEAALIDLRDYPRDSMLEVRQIAREALDET